MVSSGQVTEQDSVVLQLTENTQSGMELVQQQQRQDPNFAKLIDYLRDGTLPESYCDAQQIMVQGKKSYHVVDDILYYKSADVPGRCRLVVPKREFLMNTMTHVFPDILLQGKIMQRVSQYFHWDGISTRIYEKYASCIVCAFVKGQGLRGKPPLVNIPVGGVFEFQGGSHMTEQQSYCPMFYRKQPS